MLHTPWRRSSSRYVTTDRRLLCDASAKRPYSQLNRPVRRSAFRQRCTYSLNAPSDRSTRARATSRPAANQPLGCFSLGGRSVIAGTQAKDFFAQPVFDVSLLRGGAVQNRSEERRVGKECRSRWSPYH